MPTRVYLFIYFVCVMGMRQTQYVKTNTSYIDSCNINVCKLTNNVSKSFTSSQSLEFISM